MNRRKALQLLLGFVGGLCLPFFWLIKKAEVKRAGLEPSGDLGVCDVCGFPLVEKEEVRASLGHILQDGKCVMCKPIFGHKECTSLNHLSFQNYYDTKKDVESAQPKGMFVRCVGENAIKDVAKHNGSKLVCSKLKPTLAELKYGDKAALWWVPEAWWPKRTWRDLVGGNTQICQFTERPIEDFRKFES